MLGPLQDNGGPTFTEALLPDSPAIDAGDNDHCPQTDQRSMIRPLDGDGDGTATCDIGSYEAGGSYLTVTTLEDELNSDGDCSIREAVEAANTNAAIDLCGSGNSLFDLIGFEVIGTITLSDPLTITNDGELVIDGNDAVLLSGDGKTRVMYTEPGSEQTLLNLVISDGYISGNGAGIFNQGKLTLGASTITGNEGNYGGGIYNLASLTIYESTFFGNSGLSGAGLQNFGTLVITNSTFTANQARDWAGGIDNFGTMTIYNSTISGNSLLTENGAGAGITNGPIGNSTLVNSIVANNQGGDCFGDIIDGGHNLDSDGTCNLNPINGSLPNTDPLLGSLQDNGGPTLTQALSPDSPAIDAGDNDHCPSIDQRGFIRPLDGDGDAEAVCDMGAYEAYTGYLLVNTLLDEMESDGNCSLREALEAANTNSFVDACGQGWSAIDTILFNVEGTIHIVDQLSVVPAGTLVVEGEDAITISGDQASRIWWVEPDSFLTLQRLNIEDAFLYDEQGGGLYNDAGSVVISESNFISNTAEWGGGAIFNLGDLSIINSTFVDNIASEEHGGAIANRDELSVINSTFSGGLAYGCGGIDNEGVGTIENSTFSSNTTFWGGGGLCNTGYLSFINNTVTGNSIGEGSGGGIFNSGTLNMTNSTITANTGPSGGGLSGGNGIVMVNTIVADNVGGDCDSSVIDAGHNLDSDGTCDLNLANGSLPNTDPLLGPLADNGGPTFTHKLYWYSPAIDAGDNEYCPATDQRSIMRPIDGNRDGLAVCDIGSFEYNQVHTIFLPIVQKHP